LISFDLGNTFLKTGITEAVMSTKVTTKGQVTIPKTVREMLRLEPGGEVEFRLNDRNEVVVQRVDGKKVASRFDKYRGMLGPGLTTDEIMALTRGDDWHS
jgi:AbrB family looped-hinge helix DNA binding protein